MSRHAQRGAALPEAAIIISVLLLLIFGIIDFGRAFYTYGLTAQLARQGARWAIVRGSGCTLLNDCNATSPQVQSYVQGLAANLPSGSGVTATASWPNACNATGCPVLVTVNVPFHFLGLILPGPSFNMSSSSQMVISQ